MTRVTADPRFVATLAVVGGFAALLPAPDLLRIALTVPLALVLPGLALSLVFLPDSDGWLGRLPVSVATSVALAAVTGLLLTWTSIGLGLTTWVPVLMGTTLVGAGVAWLRQSGPTASSRDLRPRLHRRPTLAVLAAGALVFVAVALARTPFSAGEISGYSALWVLPNKANAGSIKVGVINAEASTTSYRLVIFANGRVVVERPLTLSVGERWTGVLDVSSIPPHLRSFDARLIKTGQPNQIYREATLVLPGSKAPPATGIWLIPGADQDTMRVLVTNAEAGAERFRIELRAGGRTYLTIRPRIDAGENWTKTVDFASVPVAERSFEAVLSRNDGESWTPYRRATLSESDG